MTFKGMIWHPGQPHHLVTMEAPSQMLVVAERDPIEPFTDFNDPSPVAQMTTRRLWHETVAVRDPKGNFWTLRVFVDHTDREALVEWAETVFNPEAFKEEE